MKNFRIFITYITFCAAIAFMLTRPGISGAATIDELQRSIAEKSSQIEALSKEIEELDKKAQDANAQGKTLQSAINTLDASANKLTSQVKLTESKISKTNLTISQTSLEIADKQKKIQNNLVTIAKTFREMNAAENTSAIETILSEKTLSDAWGNIETLERFQSSIEEQITELEDHTKQLATKKAQSETLKQELQYLKDELVDQKVIVESNKKEKSTLLSKTKSQEAAYKKLRDEKQALIDAVQSEIFNIESQIKFTLDPSSIPHGTGILSWPLDKVYITQRFGNTSFAKTGVYNGRGHNGLDFRAAIGTPVKAVLGGIVEETGDTGILPKCLSYGRWVFIRHANGLASVYGHLSLIKAKAGDVVKTGDVVGYSGETGYAFGPHLHLSLFASAGVNVAPLSKSVNCKNIRIPIASQSAYLDPFPYF